MSAKFSNLEPQVWTFQDCHALGFRLFVDGDVGVAKRVSQLLVG